MSRQPLVQQSCHPFPQTSIARPCAPSGSVPAPGASPRPGPGCPDPYRRPPRRGQGPRAPPPGHGPHRYVFTVFAVDTDRLDVTPEDSGAKYGFNLHFHTLAKASITATYENVG